MLIYALFNNVKVDIFLYNKRSIFIFLLFERIFILNKYVLFLSYISIII